MCSGLRNESYSALSAVFVEHWVRIDFLPDLSTWQHYIVMTGHKLYEGCINLHIEHVYKK